MSNIKITAKQIYDEYTSAKSFFEKHGYYTRCNECFSFYNGDQWKGLKTANEKPPSMNILAPIVNHKVAIIAQDGMSINYTSMNYGRMRKFASHICEMLSRNAQKLWERMKMDREIWSLATQSAVCGDAFAYFYMGNEGVQFQPVDTTNVYFADETESDVQKQKYIIITQRLYVDDVKREAVSNQIPKKEIELILADNDTADLLGDKAKSLTDKKGSDEKCLCFLKMWKDNDDIYFLKSTKDVVYQEPTVIKNLKMYPLAHMVWKPEKGFSRGMGEIYPLIPNQVEINKALARYLAVIKHCAYPHVIYNTDMISGSDEIARLLGTVGSVIGLDSPRMQKVSDAISYLQPAQINPASMEIIETLQERTRELAGASDATTGQIDPTQASGAAIIAVRDAAALSLNNQQAYLKQFVEDIARIWLNMWCAYDLSGIIAETVNVYGELVPQVIPIEVMNQLSLEARVDISPQNPYSRFAQEQALQNLLASGYISFEEYVQALDDDAASPKAKLTDIIQKRKVMKEQMNQVLLSKKATQSNENEPNAEKNYLRNESETEDTNEHNGRIANGY